MRRLHAPFDGTRRAMNRARIDIVPPDLTAYRDGNTGIPYVTRLDSGKPGPHVVVVALIHGNEICGAAALDHLLREGLRPARGALSFIFANAAAYAEFDASDPLVSRYIDEDLNRVWDKGILDGSGSSAELKRARELRPVFDSADFLLDLHSMQSSSTPLILAGMTQKSLALARRVGSPALIVRDRGHQAGPRLRDYADFSEESKKPAALLIECGQHWEKASVDMAIAVTRRFLAATGILEASEAARILEMPTQQQRVITVTEAVTSSSPDFRFLRDFHGLEIIPKAGTAIAKDGGRVITTPYDDCVLIMPSRHLAPRQTAVRLGRYDD
jgi:predicted deacylase